MQREDSIREIDDDDEEGALPPDSILEAEEDENEVQESPGSSGRSQDLNLHTAQLLSPLPATTLDELTVPEPPPLTAVECLPPTILCDSESAVLALQNIISGIAKPVERDAYHSMALRNAFATLTEYAGNLGIDGRTFLKQMYSEFALPPPLANALLSAQVALNRPRPLLNIPAPPERANNKRRRMSPLPDIPTTDDLDPTLLGFHLHQQAERDNLSDLTQSEDQSEASSASNNSSSDHISEEELTDVEEPTPPPLAPSSIRQVFRPPPPPPPDEEESLKLPLWNTGLPRRLFSQ